MKKVVINNCHGGFGLSELAIQRYAELSGFNVYFYCTDFENGDRDTVKRWNPKHSTLTTYAIKQDLGETTTSEILNKAEWFHDRDLDRSDPILIQVIEELRDKANGFCASLKIVEIPDDIDYEIAEYDGLEHVAETHRTWY